MAIVAHPRLWLTAAKLTDIQAQYSGNTARWTTFLTWLNAHINDTISTGYQGGWYLTHLPAYALAYKITGSTAYSDRAIAIMNDMVSKQSNFQSDSYYGSRNYSAWGLGFDWCYDQLSAQQKTDYVSTINTWTDDVKANGYQRTGPGDSNYFSGHLLWYALTSYAIYGDNGSRDQSDVDYAVTLYDNQIVPLLSGRLKGGIQTESDNYGPNTTMRTLQVILAQTTADDAVDLISSGAARTWIDAVASAYLHGIRPKKGRGFDQGGFSGDYVGFLNASLLEMLPDSQFGLPSAFREYMTYARENCSFPLAASAWHRFLWYDSTRVATYWSGLDLSYLAQGQSRGVARSSWTDAGAIWTMFHIGPGYGGNHEDYDAGHFEIARGGAQTRDDYLVVNAGMWRGSADGFSGTPYAFIERFSMERNCLRLYNATLTYPPGADFRKHSDILAPSWEYVSGSYAFMQGNYQKAYVRWVWPTAYYPLSRGHRRFYYLNPDYLIVYDDVVLDPVQVGDPTTVDMAFCWHVGKAPTIGGDDVLVTMYDSDCIARAIRPAGTTITATRTRAGASFVGGVYTETGAEIIWRCELTPTGNPLSQRFLVVYRAGANGLAMPTTVELTPSNFQGVHIKDSGTNLVVLGSTTGGSLTGVSYSVTPTVNKVTRHIVSDLQPSTNYDVGVSVGGGVHSVVIAAGSALVSSGNGVLAFDVSYAGVVTGLGEASEGESDPWPPYEACVGGDFL